LATPDCDNVGNLQSVTYPVHTYGYDTRNRLANLGVAKGTNNLAGYSYTLDAAGHRTSVTEQSGRTVNCTYDNLYRLTNEAIAADPSGINGAVVFDIKNNEARLISYISYEMGTVTVLALLTHKEYDKGGWKNACNC